VRCSGARTPVRGGLPEGMAFFQQRKGEPRREFLLRNYISVLDYIVLHGRDSEIGIGSTIGMRIEEPQRS
jgi:hypothetical protein